jgi:multiple sugar transport system permease protein
MIIFLAGLQGIDNTYYEAAEIDGASHVQKFFTITVPLLSPIIFFLIIISLTNAFKVFIPMFIMTPTGGPDRTTMTMVFFLFDRAFRTSNELGYGAAIAFVLLLIILGVTLFQRAILNKRVHYE